LNIFANGSLPVIRQKTAELCAKMLSEKLTGPRIRLIMQRFLPPLFMDAMKDNAEAAVNTFEGTYENPELIWNEESRERVSKSILRMADRLYAKQSAPDGGAEQKWTILEDLQEAGVQNVTEATSTLYTSVALQGEIVVSGVFIRLFIANPGWVLRKPKEFLTDLFELWSDYCNRKQVEGEPLELVTQALVLLFNAQPLMLDGVPNMGTLPQVVQALNSKKDAIVGAGLQVCNQVAANENCLKSLIGQDLLIQSFKQAMEKRTDLVPVASDALCKMFTCQIVVDEFVSQALKCELIDFLLKLLESNLHGIDKQASAKAQIVNALKAMLNSIQYLSQVEAILNKSKIWRDYRDQKHDLFISNTTAVGYLTGGVPSVAGYLTAGAPGTVEKAPPPTNILDDSNNLFK
jgi:DnaJ family protein C protein 13